MASSGAGDDVDMSAGAGSGGGGRTITEAALYDRQLRMWGHDAQRRMRDTRVLVTGFRGTTSEVTKNLVLGGIGVTLHDTGVATEADLGAHLFLRPADVGANRAEASLARVQELNGFVKVDCVTTPLASQDAAFWARFNFVVADGDVTPIADLITLDDRCRATGAKLFIVHSYGLLAAFFADHGEHTFYHTDAHMKPLAHKPDPVSVSYDSLRDTLAGSWAGLGRLKHVKEVIIAHLVVCNFRMANKRMPTAKDATDVIAMARVLCAERGAPAKVIDEDVLRTMCACATAELTPVCAVLGGVLGNEIVKVITGKGEPICNVFAFEGAKTMRACFLRVPSAAAAAAASEAATEAVA